MNQIRPAAPLGQAAISVKLVVKLFTLNQALSQGYSGQPECRLFHHPGITQMLQLRNQYQSGSILRCQQISDPLNRSLSVTIFEYKNYLSLRFQVV